MALPILIPIGIAIAGALGVGKGVKAAVDSSKASDINSSARSMVNSAENQLEAFRTKTNDLLANYGEKKLEAFSINIAQFIELFSRLKNVTIENSPELENLQLGKFTEVTIAELKHSCTMATDAAKGMLSGAAGGALTAFGAYSGTMMLASAGTGTAISALSGIAATNATMAWLGGGTLAAGGMGVAGGTMVLGIMVAGPALLIFGSILGASASKKLNNARENMERAETFQSEIQGVCGKLAMIQQTTNMATSLLSNLRTKLRRANNALAEVISKTGVDYQQYNQAEQGDVLKAVKFAQLVKTVVDVPILDANGNLIGDAEGRLKELQGMVKS